MALQSALATVLYIGATGVLAGFAFSSPLLTLFQAGSGAGAIWIMIPARSRHRLPAGVEGDDVGRRRPRL